MAAPLSLLADPRLFFSRQSPLVRSESCIERFFVTSPKAVLRNSCLERRLELATLHPTAGRDVGMRVTELLGTAARGKTVAGYMTLEDELDCRPALAMLHTAGATLALPVAGARTAGLVFRAWQ